MHNIGKRKTKDISDIATSLDVMCDYVDTSYNKVWIGPQDLTPDTGLAPAPVVIQSVAASGDRPPIISFTGAAATTAAHYFFQRPPLWIKGHMKATLYYFDKGLAGAWRVVVRLNPVQLNSVVNIQADSTATFTINDTAPGLTIRSVDITSSASLYTGITQADLGVHITIVRAGADAADTSAAAFDVLGLELTYVEDKITLGTKPYTI